MGGLIFDWLRTVYKRITYYVKYGDMQSAEFKAFIGLSLETPRRRSYETSFWPIL
jgi:hypothetical protein